MPLKLWAIIRNLRSKLKFARIVFVFFLVPTAMVGSVFLMNQKGVFNLENIEINILGFDSHPHYFSPLSQSVKDRLQVYRGKSLWLLDLKMISKEIFQEDWIAQARVSRKWPVDLEVTIVPKNIKLLLVQGNSGFSPVDDQGKALQPVKSSQAPRLPILRSSIFVKDEKLRKQAVDFVQQLPVDGKFSQQSVSEIYYDNKRGFWTTLIDQNIQVNLGKENLPLRSARVAQVLEYMDSREMQARVIDADLSKKVLVRLRKDP